MRRLHATILLFVVILGTAACSTTPPEEVVSDYMATLVRGDLQKAAEFLEASNADMLTIPDMDEGERLGKAILAKVTYTVGEPIVQGDSATVELKISAPDLLQITGQLMGEMLSMAFSMALSGQTLSPEQMQSQMMQAYENRINDLDAPMLASDVQVKLIRKGNTWAIVPDDALANALTGNMIKAMQELAEGK